MQKADAEKRIRHYCHEWRRTSGNDKTPADQLNFTEFHRWLETHHSECLDFRSTGGVRYIIDLWFDQEFKQDWKR